MIEKIKYIKYDNIRISKGEYDLLYFFYFTDWYFDKKMINAYSNKINLSLSLSYKHSALIALQKKIYKCSI